jgi:hypothetical protein
MSVVSPAWNVCCESRGMSVVSHVECLLWVMWNVCCESCGMSVVSHVECLLWVMWNVCCESCVMYVCLWIKTFLLNETQRISVWCNSIEKSFVEGRAHAQNACQYWDKMEFLSLWITWNVCLLSVKWMNMFLSWEPNVKCLSFFVSYMKRLPAVS